MEQVIENVVAEVRVALVVGNDIPRKDACIQVLTDHVREWEGLYA